MWLLEKGTEKAFLNDATLNDLINKGLWRFLKICTLYTHICVV